MNIMNFLKFLSPAALLALLPMFLIEIGTSIKNKDDNSTGSDDAFGNVLIALAPALSSFGNRNDSKVKQALKAVRDTINNYLNE